MSNNQNDERFPGSMEDSRTAQERFTSSAFSGELDADDLAFLSDQQSEMIVGGDGCSMNLPCPPPSSPFPPGLDGLPPGLDERPPGWDRGNAPWKKS